MTHTSLIAVIVFSSLVTRTAVGASILCAWTKVLPAGEVHYSFLRRSSRPASPSLRLYHSSWSEERALLGCAWSDEAAVIRNYFTLCRERAHHFSDHPDENLDVDSIFEAEDQCVSLAPAGRRSVRSVNGHEGEDGRSEGRIHQRVKRSFIVPGTLWCGSGNKAPSYQDLGRLVLDTDSKLLSKLSFLKQMPRSTSWFVILCVTIHMYSTPRKKKVTHWLNGSHVMFNHSSSL